MKQQTEHEPTRYIKVDIFFCKRQYTARAIFEYLHDIERYDGVQCANYVLMGSTFISHKPDVIPNIYRLFSIQRGKTENRVIVNLISVH